MPRKLISTDSSSPPFPFRHWVAGCCGALEVSLAPREVDASAFLKEMAPVRFYMYLLENCTLGCLIIKELLPANHPLVVEAKDKKLEGFHFLPFKDKFFTFYIIEEAPLLNVKVRLYPLSSYSGVTTSKIIPEVTQLKNVFGSDPFSGRIKDWSSIHYGVQVATSGSDPNPLAHVYQEKGFQQFPFNHRVHSGTPRRMLLWVRVPTEEDLSKERANERVSPSVPVAA